MNREAVQTLISTTPNGAILEILVSNGDVHRGRELRQELAKGVLAEALQDPASYEGPKNRTSQLLSENGR